MNFLALRVRFWLLVIDLCRFACGTLGVPPRFAKPLVLVGGNQIVAIADRTGYWGTASEMERVLGDIRCHANG